MSNQRSLKSDFSGIWLADLIGLGLVPVFVVGSVFSYILVAGSAVRILPGWFLNKNRPTMPLSTTDVASSSASLLAFAIVLTALVTSSITCCENKRFFVQITPYLIPVSAYVIDRSFRELRRRQLLIWNSRSIWEP